MTVQTLSEAAAPAGASARARRGAHHGAQHLALGVLRRLLPWLLPLALLALWQVGAATGWNAPDSAPWFAQALHAASHAHFGAPCGYIGQGGTIPLMNQLSQGFPSAQMMVCGVLGPRSNAHGPNEFLHVPYAKRLTAAVAEVIARMP